MKDAGELERENAALRDRLSRLSQASLRINESLDFDTVLQRVLDSACSLTGARYGVITLLDESGRIQDFVYSGLTPEESRQFAEFPNGMLFFEYLSSIGEPLRLRDFHSYIRELGLPEFRPPMAVSSALPFLAAPIRHLGESVGAFYVGEKELEFTPEDEETLVMFASQAALVIANARKHREEQRTRADLETLVNTTPVGVLVLDAGTGEVRSINREARRIVSGLCEPGGTAEQLLEALTYLRADGREFSLRELPLAQTLSTGETVRAEEIVLQSPGGRSVTTLINATPILSEEGEVDSVVITIQDLTPLEDLERLRAEFLGMVSHELRTPLAAIKGSAATLTEAAFDLDTAEMLQFFRIIGEQADSMRDLIGDLLDVARIETGALPVSPAAVDVASLVDEARSAFQNGGGRSNLVIDIPPDLPRVMADRRRIVQVLSNLLSNAAQAFELAVPHPGDRQRRTASTSPSRWRTTAWACLPSGCRTCSASSRGSTARSGDGRSPGRAWDSPSARASWRPTGAASGPRATGLAWEAGSPSPFRRWRRPSPFPPPRSRRRRTKTGEQPRVLCVDDDPQTLRYVRDALTKAHYTPIVTGDPEEVSRLMAEEAPRLVLLDMMLPGSDGMELMKDIREVSDAPVIFLSVNGQEEVVARAFDMGAADYVVKPFSATELAARIRAALRRRAAPELAQPSEPYVRGDLTVDYPQRRVTVAGNPVELTDIEYRLLVELSVNADRALTHERLLQRVWGPDKGEDSGPVRNIVKRLRRKLGEDASNPAFIFAVPRVGYRMEKGEGQEREESQEVS